MTTFFIIVTVLFSTLIFLGRKDKDKKLTAFQQERYNRTHLHY
jgi:hypothetical protein